jgi:hypothetical protein
MPALVWKDINLSLNDTHLFFLDKQAEFSTGCLSKQLVAVRVNRRNLYFKLLQFHDSFPRPAFFGRIYFVKMG